MRKSIHILTLAIATVVLSVPAVCASKKTAPESPDRGENTALGPAVLWRNPTDIASRDLFYGPGGEKHQPHGPFTFIKEDLDGTSPKFDVRDGNDVKWKVKLGEEARPETVATRLVWAAGYFTDEDYFLPNLQVANMPQRLHRGQELVARDGSMHNVRLKRHMKGEEKLGNWQWRQDPFTNTRELNGLRVAMALINNWDLKDENNKVLEYEHKGEGPEQIYEVSDLGASFGTTGRKRSRAVSKGNLQSYRRSQFITKVTPEFVDFKTPSRPSFVLIVNPREYISRVHLEWIGKHIPRGDARWLGELMARLSPAQIREAFRAAGYSREEIEGFSKIVEGRIAKLNEL
jgi:hypothetical protein